MEIFARVWLAKFAKITAYTVVNYAMRNIRPRREVQICGMALIFVNRGEVAFFVDFE